MSTLDQAFIRAYSKDRRAASVGATESVQAEASHGASVSPRAEEARSTTASPTELDGDVANSESGRWYRVDSAGNMHTRRQHMKNPAGTTESAETKSEDESPSIPQLSSSQAASSEQAAATVMHSRHAGHRLPPYPHMVGNPSAPVTEQSVHAVQNPSGRRTLASYLAQNQASIELERETIHGETRPESIAIPQEERTGQVSFTGISPVTSRSPATSGTETSSDSPVTSHKSERPAEISALAAGDGSSMPTKEAKGTRTITQEAAKSTLKMPAVGHFRSTRTDRPATQETETAKTKFAATPFPSAWEVDSFTWPEVQAKLMVEQEKAFTKVAAHLSDACRQGLQVLVVTSPTQGEGRSTVASCIARSVAQRGIQVALVDGDLESPTLADSLNLDIEQGWSDALMDGVPLEEIAVHSIEDKLTLIPLAVGASASNLKRVDRYIGAMLDRLRESFDLIVIDATFMNSLDHRLVGTEAHETVDAMILVTDGRKEDQQRLDTAVRRIRNLGVSSVGIVENFTQN